MMLQKTTEAARQRMRFRLMGSNFPASNFVSVLLMAQQSAHPKALISPIKGQFLSQRSLGSLKGNSKKVAGSDETGQDIFGLGIFTLLFRNPHSPFRIFSGGPNGNRTRVFGVRGRRPRPLDDGTFLVVRFYRSLWLGD